MLGVRVPPGLPLFIFITVLGVNTMTKLKEEQKKQSTGVQKKGNGSKSVLKKKPGWLVFLQEVNVEMKKVTWPARKEIIGSTGALIVATLMIGIFLGLVDFVLAKGIQPAMAGSADAWSYVTLVIFASILVWVYKSN